MNLVWLQFSKTVLFLKNKENAFEGSLYFSFLQKTQKSINSKNAKMILYVFKNYSQNQFLKIGTKQDLYSGLLEETKPHSKGESKYHYQFTLTCSRDSNYVDTIR